MGGSEPAYFDEGVYQRVFLLGGAAPLALQLREEGLARVFGEEGDDERAEALADRAVLVFHGVVGWHDLVAEDAEGDFGVELEVLYERRLDHGELFRLV